MHPKHKITIDGNAFAAAARLLMVEVTDDDGDGADRVEITLDDAGGVLEIPERGAMIDVSLGYRETGLTWLGSFALDGVSGEGPVRTMTITGTAADMAGPLRAPKSRAWEEKTLSDIVGQIASEAGLSPTVEAGIGATFYPFLAQTAESDLHFLTRLAAELDAIVKPAAQKLVVVPKNEGINAEGEPIVPIRVVPVGISDWTWQLEERGNYGTVEAEWRDIEAGETRKVTAGDEKPVKRLRHVYATEAEAARAAEAELKRAQREAVTLNVTLAYFNPAAFAGGTAIIARLKPGFEGEWYIKRVTHRMPPLVTELELKKGVPA
ncbi:phage late control D family protein [Maritimibacter sp. HL-12]|uniref:phage late control D family protein n=1 Tax=Maritimibacter sp. HL-12 TaxID=1162418 RepID=UPI000A0EFA1A|nr:contractile injection system protein, VgrG/Pvc8 family [Maritimibacter sp. HL-12]SMH35735.1 hypothetical protein SAMN05661107_0639 [Maritimibacter sp. HL-12]